MKVNVTYRSLLDKSIASMLSAIEIYNKPNFQYREETFSILAVNSWELLLKAHLYKLCGYNDRVLYELIPATLKNGSQSKKKKIIARNRCNNPKSISIYTAIYLLVQKHVLPKNLQGNLEALIELRDNSIHFYNSNTITKPIQELGFACIKNYLSVIRKWEVPIDISKYNFYLMPLAYVDGKLNVEGTLTEAEMNYLTLLKTHITREDVSDEDFDIAVKIAIDFKKGNSIEDSIGMHYDAEGLSVNISEEDNLKKYPLSYGEVAEKCRERYSDFKYNKDFHQHMNAVKRNSKLSLERKLDPHNPKSQKKFFFNGALLKEMDKYYTKR